MIIFLGCVSVCRYQCLFILVCVRFLLSHECVHVSMNTELFVSVSHKQSFCWLPASALCQNNQTLNLPLFFFFCALRLVFLLFVSLPWMPAPSSKTRTSPSSVRRRLSLCNSTQTNRSYCHYISPLAWPQNHNLASIQIHVFIVSLHVYVSTEVKFRVKVLIGFLWALLFDQLLPLARKCAGEEHRKAFITGCHFPPSNAITEKQSIIQNSINQCRF